MKMQPTDHAKFTAWRDSGAQNLKLPGDWKELSCKTQPASMVVWQFQWYLSCGNDRYIKIWERYDRWPNLIGMSRRVSFVYHYGLIVGVGKVGLPTEKPQNPVDIRIDNINRPFHMHLGAPDPHHDQSVITGLILEDMDMFEFLNGIIRHRSNNKPMNKIFGFTIG